MKKRIKLLFLVLFMFLGVWEVDYTVNAATKYKVTYDTNGGEIDEDEEYYSEYEYGETLKVPEKVTKDGYRFAGWYVGSWRLINPHVPSIYIPEDFPEYRFKKDVTAVARWIAVEPYRIYCILGGEDSFNKDDYFEVNYGEVPEIYTYSRNGYTFLGWYEIHDGGVEIPFDVTKPYLYDDHIRIYAKWRKDYYKLTLDTNSDHIKLEDENGNLSRKVTYEDMHYDDKLDFLPYIVSNDYIFLGWFTEPTGGEKVSKNDCFWSEEDVTLYAHWKKIVNEEPKKEDNDKVSDSKTNVTTENKSPANNNSTTNNNTANNPGVDKNNASNVIGQAKIKSVKLSKTGKMTIKIKSNKKYNYRIQVSTSKKFSKKKTKTYETKKSKYVVKGLRKDKKYYVRVRYVAKDKTNAVGKWSKTTRVKK